MTTTPKLSVMEKHSRKLVEVLAEFYPGGSSCEELRRKFEKIARRGHSIYYEALRFCRDRRWIVNDGPTLLLNPDNSWRIPPDGDGLGEHPVWGPQFQHVLDMREARIDRLEARNRRLAGSRKAIAAGEVAGPVCSALTAIMTDANVSVRKRVAAAEQLITYKSPPDVADAAKAFLALVFMDPDQNIDDRLAATTALRRSEDVKIVPAIERPSLVRADEPMEPVEALADLVSRQRQRAVAMQVEMARELAGDAIPVANRGSKPASA